MRILWKPDSQGSRFRRVPDDAIEVEKQLDECIVVARLDCGNHVLSAIKLVPEYTQSAFQLLSLKICDPAGTTLLDVGHSVSDFGKARFHRLNPVEINNYTFFIADHKDAALEFKVDSQDSHDGYELRCRWLFPDASFTASFRRHFLEELQKSEKTNHEYQQKLEQQAAELERLAGLERELNIIKQSRVWKLAETLRKRIYGDWLSRFPDLQSRLLSRSRSNIKISRESSGKFSNLKSDRITTNLRADRYENLRHHWQRSRPSDTDLKTNIAALQHRPLISVIVPVYNPVRSWLEDCVNSVLTQSYGNWELCICDDASTSEEVTQYLSDLNHPKVKKVRLEANLGIAGATNRAIELADGEFLAFLDHDDLLDPDALYHVCEAINDYQPDCLYSDEDYVDALGNFFQPNFKPDFSPDTLLSHNYITHLLVVRTELLEHTGPLNPEYDGAQDYDLVLRITEAAGSIMHIPRILYHWRQSEHSSSLSVSAKPYIQSRTREMLSQTMQRRGETAEILNANLPHFFYTRRTLDSSPKVTIIVPFRDEPELLRGCLQSVLSNTSYRNYEVLGVNNQSSSPLTFSVMEEFASAHSRIRFIDFDHEFNFAAIINYAVANSYGNYIALLNNDIEIITWEWLEAMLCQAQSDTTGVVGGKLFYPDNSIQHAGVVVGIDGYAGHAHKRAGCNEQGYGNRLQIVHNVAAVTGAFMLFSRSVFDQVGGFDAEHFPVACNDVDFCLRVIEAGFWNVFTPYAKAYHLESASRGHEMSEAQQARFDQEKSLFRERHEEFLELGDPFYNQNLTLESESFLIKSAQELEH